MTSTIRNLIIGAVVTIVVAAGAALAFSGGEDNGTDDTEVAVTATTGDDGTGDGGSDGGGGTGGGNGDGSQGGEQGQDGQDGGGGNGGGDGDESPPPEEQATGAPTVNLVDQRCNPSNQLIASITASASNAYRKGVKSVTMSRQNDEGAYLSFNGQWLGPETGAGDRWDATLNYGVNFGKTLRVVATSDSNQSTTKDYQITVNC